MIPKFTAPKSLSKEEFFGKLFAIRDAIHLAHLSTKSYAQHVALGSFYDSLLEFTDGLIESYQGKYGIVKISITPINGEALPLIKDLASLTDGGLAYSAFTETWIQNELDSISMLAYQTIYKLENLK